MTLLILVNISSLGFPLGVDSSLFEFKEFDQNHLSVLQKPDGVNKYFKVEVEKHPCLALLRNHYLQRCIILL